MRIGSALKGFDRTHWRRTTRLPAWLRPTHDERPAEPSSEEKTQEKW
jgi:hypothetical protein